MKRIAAAAGLLTTLLAISALAQIPIPMLPPANVPLTGAEMLPLSQSGVTRRATVSMLAAPLAAPITNRDVYVSTAGSDANTGTQWSNAKLTLQAAVTAASGSTGGVVHVGAGTYTLPAPALMQPNVRVDCLPGATITQANAANLTSLFDFATNTASGAGVSNCIIDGNRANNTDSGSAALVNVGTASDVLIIRDSIVNGSGAALDITTGLRPIITGNRFSNFYVGGIFVNGAPTQTRGQFVGNVFSGALGQHAITLQASDYNTVSQNHITGALQTGMTVNVSGTAVTWVSGSTFTSLNKGEFVVVNGGTEATIASITDSTHLVLGQSSGTASGVAMGAGPGDLISLVSASHNIVSENNITGGVSGAIVLSNFAAGGNAGQNLITGNVIQNVGGACISLQSEATFSSVVADNQVTGNAIVDCGLEGAAANVSYVGGISLADFSPTTLLRTLISGNSITDSQATPTIQYGVNLSSVSAGQVFYGDNATYADTATPLTVKGGILSVTPDAGWGTTATATFASYGNAFVVHVASSGTGQAANPKVTVSMASGPAGNPPVMACQDISNLTTHAFVYNQQPGAFSVQGQQVFFWQATPSAGVTYDFLCRG